MHELLPGIVAIVVLGMAAQWAAWRLNLPSILLLLGAGLLAGPVTGVLLPGELFGDLMEPIVSMAVAVILFEGGLSLRFSDLEEMGAPIRNLISVGVLATWALAAAAAYWILGLPPSVAILLGAILVVTGPTVIVPMLRHLQPAKRAGAAARWEGIINDPIGAILAVLVFEVIEGHGSAEALGSTALILGKTIGIGVATGIAGAWFVSQALKRLWLPDFLRNPVTLAVVFGIYAISDVVQQESGLFSVTLMGMWLANRGGVTVHAIAEFKEDLQVLLISFLFVMLSADLSRETLLGLGWESLAFVAALIVVVRPVAVVLSALGTQLSWREQVFLMWMAPRGIVAAAVSSIFALRLSDAGFPGSELIVPVTFAVIAGTVAFYGLTAPFVTRRLGLSQSDPQGLVFIGAFKWTRDLASVLHELEVPVRLVDTNHNHVSRSRELGLPAIETNILSDHGTRDVDLSGIGKVFAVTPDDEINVLAALQFEHIFGKEELYRMQPDDDEAEREVVASGHAPKVILGERTFDEITTLVDRGHRFQAVLLTSREALPWIQDDVGPDFLPIAIVRPSGRVDVYTTQEPVVPVVGDQVVFLGPVVSEELDLPITQEIEASR